MVNGITGNSEWVVLVTVVTRMGCTSVSSDGVGCIGDSGDKGQIVLVSAVTGWVLPVTVVTRNGLYCDSGDKEWVVL